MAKYKIGIFGSAEGKIAAAIKKAKIIGRELTKRNCQVVTGATTGLPGVAANAAYVAGGEVIGFSANRNWAEHIKITVGDKREVYKKLVYIPKVFPFAANLNVSRKYRNVISTATCDAGIIISGRWGTLNEFTNLYDMGKVIGVLTGSGGMADELPKLLKKISKASKAIVIFNSDPKKLVTLVIKELKRRT